MATSASTHKTGESKKKVKCGVSLVWLDDGADQELTVLNVFQSIFDQVFIFKDTTACLDAVESADAEKDTLAILVTGKYGQLLVPDRLQPKSQVKYIYVYCYDIMKHSQWAQKCSKVRCVDSDLGKIFKQMQHDLVKSIKQQHHLVEEPEADEPEEEQGQEAEAQPEESSEPQRFSDDNNLFDQLALDLVTEFAEDENDGFDEFKTYNQAPAANQRNEDNAPPDMIFKPKRPIKEWYKLDLSFIRLNSTNLARLWTLRWFLRLFYKQITKEHEEFVKNVCTITVYHGSWLTSDELDGMKQRIGDIIVFTEFTMACPKLQDALDVIANKKVENRKHKVIFEINADKSNKFTVPYCELQSNQVLFWFGARYRIIKIEFIEKHGKGTEPYWLIGLNLHSTLNQDKSLEGLYRHYGDKLTEIRHNHSAMGRLLKFKGQYKQAEKWLEHSDCYLDLAESAIRQNQLERATQYLSKLSEDTEDANLLRAFVHILSSNENIPKGRTILLKILSNSTDKEIRAQANIALGFINLTFQQQPDQAFDHFLNGSDALKTVLPEIHPDIAKSYIGIGYAYFGQNKIKDAEKYFRMALDIQAESLPLMHPDVAKARSGLAHCLATQRQTVPQALQELQTAYNILMHAFSSEKKRHPEILLTMQDIDRVRKDKRLSVRNTLLDYI